jgi:hypothetical protein
MNDRRFVVHDDMGDSIRTFLSRREAKWFIQNKEGFTIVEHAKRDIFTDLFNKVGEAIF